eukprot:935670-Rhodomonas_salina.1
MPCPSDRLLVLLSLHNNVNTAGMSPTVTMPTGPSPPRPELLVRLEARTDAPPWIRRCHIPGPPLAQSSYRAATGPLSAKATHPPIMLFKLD